MWRIIASIDFPLVSVDRKFYALVNGSWWPADDLVAQRAARLPEVIATEAPDAWASAEKLQKWARRSSRKATVNAAMAMLRGCAGVSSLAEVDISEQRGA
jgi:hypothetical protein